VVKKHRWCCSSVRLSVRPFYLSLMRASYGCSALVLLAVGYMARTPLLRSVANFSYNNKPTTYRTAGVWAYWFFPGVHSNWLTRKRRRRFGVDVWRPTQTCFILECYFISWIVLKCVCWFCSLIKMFSFCNAYRLQTDFWTSSSTATLSVSFTQIRWLHCLYRLVS